MDDLLRHTSQRCGGPRGQIKGARLSISGKDRTQLRIALRKDAKVGEAVSVLYSPKKKLLVIDKAHAERARLHVRRDGAENRTSYPVIIVSMSSDTPIKFKTDHPGTIDCELRELGDGRLAIPLPKQYAHVGVENA